MVAMMKTRCEPRILTQEECEILIWGAPIKLKPKRRILWVMGDEPQGRTRRFGEGSTAFGPDEVNL